ncbi:MAG: chemotaxis protein CheA [Desulfuromonadaceae bacterium]|nr:chemotaxis protein CheA [Desulfuromonadaceae bacterium]MDD2855280.1 chemotaxis protein CheA [Desulfuromonadaceae bacterium]
MQLSSLATQFVLEGRDHCEMAASGLLDLEKHSHDPDVVNGIFRSFHTLKGTSGIFPEYLSITTLTHAAESLMDLIRNGKVNIDSELTDLFLAVLDQVGLWLEHIEKSGALPVAADNESAGLLSALISKKEIAEGKQESSVAATVTETVVSNPLEEQLRDWLLQLEPASKASLLSALDSADKSFTAFCYTPVSDSFFFGDDPVSLVHTVEELLLLEVSKVLEVQFDLDYDPFVCNLRFMAVAAADIETVREIFGYVEDQISLLALTPQLFIPESPPVIEETKIQTAPEKPENLQISSSQEQGVTAVDAGGKKNTYIRVDQEHINTLMDLVGEMIIAKNSLPYLVRRAASFYKAPDLADEIDMKHGTINYIVSGLQETAMQMRMLPVARAFERFPRLVRDISKKLDKKVRLIMTGEDTQADKDVIDMLGDPLIHLVRNSLDHGVETPSERLAAGKAEEAVITLRAFQDKSDIVVEVEDDGRGIDPERIRMKAVEKGIITSDSAASMNDEEAIQLIMAAGFSTNDVVTDLSGRGVGMDVVMNMVTSLGGSVRAFSTPGSGSRMRLTLPMSMAISKILIVCQNGCTYGIPADDVMESMINVHKSRVTTVNGYPGLEVRGELLPLYSLSVQLEMSGDRSIKPGFSAVVVKIKGEAVAIAVDSFQDISDVVVKPLAGMLQKHPYYNGSTILGDGSITFILNMQEVIKNANHP